MGWLTRWPHRQRSFRYTVRAACPVSRALPLLAEFSRYPDLHPLIVSVLELPPEPPALRSYLITDLLHWGPARFKVHYRADVLRASGEEVLTVAWLAPSTRVRNHTRLYVDAGPAGAPPGLRCEVEITLRAPVLLFGYALRRARAAHAELADRLARVLTAVGALPAGQ